MTSHGDGGEAIHASNGNSELAALAAERRLKLFEQEVARADGMSLSGSAASSGKRERADRATSEQVLDPRTRMVLFKLLASGVLEELSGCISTGKEANVYSGVGKDGVPVAVKVFKTAILVFKDRQQYIEGDFRFKQGYQKGKNARKMVQVWAEKEYRNLARIREAGINSPIPLCLRSPVLVMTFCGQDGWPAPRLKEVATQMSAKRLEHTHREVIIQMRKMFKRARLVHGDLSEYNILIWGKEVVIIDVSQSVEHDHPHALEFLRRDCANVNSFFRRQGVSTALTLKELFDFITRRSDVEEDDEMLLQSLDTLLDYARANEDRGNDIDEEVFRQAFIPRDLHELADYEKDVDLTAAGQVEELFYRKMAGLTTMAAADENDSKENKADHIEAGQENEHTDSSENYDDDVESDHSSCSSSSDSSWEIRGKPDPRGGLSKKEWKAKVKAENREKREKKTPKKEKKRKATMARRRKVGGKA